MSGEEGYIRIQNKSPHIVTIKVVKGRSVEDAGLSNIEGTIAPGGQLPVEGVEKYGGRYGVIAGKVRLRIQKEGFFQLEAHVEGSSPSSTLFLKVNHDKWWSEDTTPDLDSQVCMVADVDEIDRTSKIEIRLFDNIATKSWMAELSESVRNVPLCKVKLPGTHDSATYRFDKEKGASPDSDLTSTIEEKLDRGRLLGQLSDFIIKNIFERLCKCQDKTIRQQLELGIRYLDLRVVCHKESGTFWTCHGVYCVDIKDVLKEINDFLTENPKEIVILDFNHLYEMETKHQELADIILSSLGDKVADFNEVKPHSPVGIFWEKGYQAVVLYCGREIIPNNAGKLWHPQCIRSPWPNSSDTIKLHDKLKENVTSQRDEKTFFVLQGLLTPDGGLIKSKLLETGGVSLKSIASVCNRKVVDWVLDETFQDNLNIVIVDFFDNCGLIPAVINANRSS